MELNKEQAAAVASQARSLLIYAGAGSGKTRVITHRIARLIKETGVAPHQIVGLTFTRHAAAEMRTRIETLIGYPPRGLTLLTFHAFCARLLRWEKVREGFTIYDENDQMALLKRVVQDLDLDSKEHPPARARRFIDRAKNRLQRPAHFTRPAPGQDWQVKVYRRYEQHLEKNNAFDYGDLISQAVLHLRHSPPRTNHYQERWQHILVDEYQDTNQAQYALLKQLVGPHGSICAVGDDRQSIYGWRGACPENIERLREDFPETEVLNLTRNYRSHQAILDVANCLIRTAEPGRPGLEAVLGTGEAPAVEMVADDAMEAMTVAARISKLRGEGIMLSSMAVMYRVNWLSRVFEDALRRRGISYRIISGTGFYERREVKDLLAYLKFMVNHRDVVSLERIINVPPRGIGKVGWQKIVAWEGLEGSLGGAAVDLPLAGKGAAGLSRLLGQIRSWVAAGFLAHPARLLEAIVDETDYLAVFAKEDPVRRESREGNVLELIGLARQFELEEEGDTAMFLEEMSLLTDVDRLDNDTDALNLMTLHAAKGLEFDAVFIVGLEDGLLPHAARLSDAAEMEEERRLLYVGVTRAKRYLQLSGARERRVFGQTRWQQPSRFFLDMGLPAQLAPAPLPAAPRRGRHQKRKKPRLAETGTGEWVEHPRFGRGRVVNRWGRGDRESAEIDFRSVGRKILRVAYANLREVT